MWKIDIRTTIKQLYCHDNMVVHISIVCRKTVYVTVSIKSLAANTFFTGWFFQVQRGYHYISATDGSELCCKRKFLLIVTRCLFWHCRKRIFKMLNLAMSATVVWQLVAHRKPPSKYESVGFSEHTATLDRVRQAFFFLPKTTRRKRVNNFKHVYNIAWRAFKSVRHVMSLYYIHF